MRYQVNTFFSLAIVFGIALTIVACGARDSGEDIQPISEPQTAPEAEATVELAPTPTNLPSEIVEPISPISPLSPLKEPAMAPITQEVKPIPGSEEALAAAIADLAEQSGLPADDIQLVSMEAVEWSDASLGCPQEGFMYAQVITPGYLLILEAQGQEYEYHTDRRANVVLCPEE
jgi:hypothetical protein